MARFRRERTRAGEKTVGPSVIDRDQSVESDRRRMTIDVLMGRNGPVELADLAAGIAARENGINGSDAETVASVAIALHHVHLPKMDDWGLIDYDPAENCVESCPRRHDVRLD